MGFDKCFVIFYTYHCYDNSLWQDFLNSKQQALKIENTESKAESESYKSRVAKRETKAAKTLGHSSSIYDFMVTIYSWYTNWCLYGFHKPSLYLWDLLLGFLLQLSHEHFDLYFILPLV